MQVLHPGLHEQDNAAQIKVALTREQAEKPYSTLFLLNQIAHARWREHRGWVLWDDDGELTRYSDTSSGKASDSCYERGKRYPAGSSTTGMKGNQPLASWSQRTAVYLKEGAWHRLGRRIVRSLPI